MSRTWTEGARTAVTTAGVLLASVLWLALPASAPAAISPPGVGTGAASAVTYGSATLAGSIDPHASNTTYYFQYGPTRAYGAQTPLADAGAGTRAVKVSAAITGLKPLTVYHYRLLAVNAAGAATGVDRTFKTAKVPLSLQILVAPNPTIFGGAATVEGTLSGTGNAGRAVVLQQNPFPYTAGFANVGNAELTTSTGGFAFPVSGLTQATQYRVITMTTPPVVSPIAIENVAVAISAHVGRTHHRRHARFYGTVSPAVDGMQVAIMRVVGGRNVLVAGTALRHGSAASSRFSRVLHVKRGLYRVFVKVTNGSQVSNYSTPLFIR
ncbi:MAG TPA: hypothetical protein VGI76_08985 [Solirubrobacteraceae bacterium]|jgi:hypothetical protein